ncbi:9415_t:CDS:2 [Dentiscutata erythropus]|uniref:9415_t:CDS:1 n=1 Tax=Dentiscutata erythropus TaxID=1348616 RepID=A0A9N9AGX9_9GLOM|nr:9415_t:CDS:2 [Dentiscutata erythropus]
MAFQDWDLITNEITIAFQDWVDMLNPIFELNNNQDEPILAKEDVNMNFKSSFLVQDMSSDSDLAKPSSISKKIIVKENE